MSNIELTNKTVKCRKIHKCVWCGIKIQINEKSQYTSGIYDNEFYSNYFHMECYKALLDSDLSDYDYEFQLYEQEYGKSVN